MHGQIAAKHREEKEKKDKEEFKMKEEPNMKINHTVNQQFHFVEVKCEVKEVRFCLRFSGRGK